LDETSNIRTWAQLNASDGSTVELTEDMAGTFERYEKIKEEEAILSAEKEAIERRIKLAIGTADIGHVGQYAYSYKTQSRRGKLSVALEHIDSLRGAGVPFNETKTSSCRVLRKLKVKES
jgi:bifunctional ADP-heptose synthase (sugar kinase/adenylyltransferase)